MAARQRRNPAAPTAGAGLIAEFSKPDDPFSLRFLIEQAAHIADDLERIRQLLSGDRDAWLQVKIGVKTVEVQVTNLLVQSRQQAEQLRKLLVDIRQQRAVIDERGDPEDDVLGGSGG